MRIARAGSQESRLRLGLGGIALLALALRLLHIGAILRSPLGTTLVGDSLYYHHEAGRILGILKEADPSGVRFMNVGYPHFLAVVYALVGPVIPAILWLQAAAGALTAVLVALGTRRLLGSDRVAILAGALYAAYAGAIFYDGLLLTPCLTNAALAVAFLAMSAGLPKIDLLHAAAAGVAVAYAVLLRASMALMALALALIVMAVPKPGRSLPVAAVLILAALSLSLPTVAYHGWVHGQWVPLTANGGVNFWIGNHREATGVYSAASFLGSQSPAEEERSFLAEARRRTGDPGLTLAGSSDFWFREGIQDIRAGPGRWLRLEASKLAYFFSRHEARTNVGLEFVRGFSPVLRFLSIGFPWIAVPGIAGFVHLLATRRYRAAGLLGCLVLVPLLTCVAFFVSGEYRHPASLGLCVTAAVALDAVARSPRRLSLLLATLLALPLVLWPHSVADLAGDPQADVFNYAGALCYEKPDGARPSREDFRRARELLERAGDERGGSRILSDAYLWLHYRAAVELEDRAEASRALLLAEDLASSLARRAETGAFGRQLDASLHDRVADLAGRDFVKNDPELAGQARDLLSRLEAHSQGARNPGP